MDSNGIVNYKKNKHPLLASQGGLDITDRDENFYNIVIEVIKDITAMLIKGSSINFLKIPIPTMLVYPETHLHAIANDFSNAELLIKAVNETNPVERAKYFFTFITSGIHINPLKWQTKAPINPLLGETLSAKNSLGMEIYLEQTSSDPPTTHYYIRGANMDFEMFGYLINVIELVGLNSLRGSKLGRNILKLKNGDALTFVYPDIEIEGMLSGTRVFNFSSSISVKDLKNKIEVCGTFYNNDFSQKPEVKELFYKWLTPNEESILLDDFIITVQKYNKQTKKSELLCNGYGSWIGDIIIDGKKFWNVSEEFTKWNFEYESKLLLQSEAYVREDLKELSKKSPNFYTAKHNRLVLEEREKDDEKLRKERVNKI